jgi:hypothetical protein
LTDDSLPVPQTFRVGVLGAARIGPMALVLDPAGGALMDIGAYSAHMVRALASAVSTASPCLPPWMDRGNAGQTCGVAQLVA